MTHDKQRLQITIQGIVQGVGFRPFIYHLASKLGLVGWVNNSAQGVFIEAEGSYNQLEIFLLSIEKEKPSHSVIKKLEFIFLNPIGYQKFEIRNSIGGEKTALISPDIATCSDCLREIFTQINRRNSYPFTNCTNCGPRFSIIEALPYDRPNTTMKNFVMCDTCQAEYDNPSDRRFHAQPNACPQCGPHLELWDREGNVLAFHDAALQMAADAICQGKIIAIKGLGGFHLIVDARCKNAVRQLRISKQRPEKPFALMYPTLELVKAHCKVSNLEEQLLRSPQAPIVLLEKSPIPNPKSQIAADVAPGNPNLGIMLPHTPLHHLLMAKLNFPVVATSGNLADEPICIDESEAIERLGRIVDIFLIHNRPIHHPVDDSIVRVFMERPMVLRCARGYAPLAIPINTKSNILAVGGHLKNTIAISINQQILISQHIGNLDTIQAFDRFKNVIDSFKKIYDFQPDVVACDLHPDYLSTQYAHNLSVPIISVQHHYAHVLSCMAENQLSGSVLGIAWDGSGYGLDGKIWGSEFLLITETSFQRVAHLRMFPLPGGEKAIKQPRRVAIGLLYELWGDTLFKMKKLAPLQAFYPQELEVLQPMLKRHLNTPLTSSMGRLFDAIASIVGLRQQSSFEGQAAMELEFAISHFQTKEYYQFTIIQPSEIDNCSPLVVDWALIVKGIFEDIDNGLAIGHISTKFHNTLVEITIAIAKYVGEGKIVLTGGCFQNRYLAERTIYRLQEENFRPYWHQIIPPNDGGIALGQLMAASRELINQE
ncbi:carbamoyltransferase HypF [Nostoc sp. UHCC 0302]|uniref:carbamoyltransferase HypF n=1 Tax=Nostoc sp. UHCC 0302 TaxID=3134896 RepID=UPI00311CA859